MSNDYLSSLPEEVLEEISKFFHDASDLWRSEPHQSYRALARTCKSLRAHFQRRVFSYLYLSTETRIRTFAELIQDNPILASYIRTIRLEVDNRCRGHFQYPPLLAIMHAASSSGIPPEITLSVGTFSKFVDDWGVNIPSNTMTYIFNAPQTILHAITELEIRRMEQAIPVSLFRLLPNLCILFGSCLALSSDDHFAEDYSSQFFRPKLDVLMLYSSNPTTITMLCEQILDLSAVKQLKVVMIELESNTLKPDSRNFLARRLLDRAPLVQKLYLDVGVMARPFYDLSRLQCLRECTLDLVVAVGANPVPHLCQLLYTLPPFPENDLKYLHLSFGFIDTLLNEDDIAGSHVLFSISTWSNFDAAIANIVASGTRPFKLELTFYIHAQNILVKSLLNSLFVDWAEKHLPKSSRQPNLDIFILPSF
ncbi:hypothetical protein BDN70DRAFT_998470 [Pholiota conissans]|uniref:F-box domain-containing protein n=1 Tax=Pholiota conissans TaxID=109636 RepID=A0A9P5YNG2_9AGAR|nr:hypothetical protein BDN70DRAFT_998470 [Pholiota conissans]